MTRRIIRAAFRHVVGYLFLLPLMLIAIAVQALIADPIFKNQSVIPNLIYKSCGYIFGVRFELSPKSVPFSDGRASMFVLNHLSRLDFVALPLFPRAAAMMNANIMKMPVWGLIVKVFTLSAGFIATEQTVDGKRRDLDRLGQAAAEGRSIVVFPEGIQTDGRRVLRYSKGSAEIFYDADILAKYPVLRGAQLQPVILRVRCIDGENVIDRPALWGKYALTQRLTNIFVGMSRLAMVRSIVVDVLVCPALNPADFKSATDLINAAHALTLDFIAPNQSETLTRKQWKARIKAEDFTL